MVNSRDFHNGRPFGVTKHTSFLKLSIQQLMSMRKEIVDSCAERGHLSVFFFPKRGDEFLRVFSSYGYRDMPAWQGTVRSLADLPTLPPDAAIHLEEYLATIQGRPTPACAFSHDAQLFCELHFRRLVQS